MGVKAGAEPEAAKVEALSRYAVDGVLPKTRLSPSSEEELAAALKNCSEQKSGVVIFGGATQIALGSSPARYEVALSTDRLDRLLEHEPADLTCSVQAGMKMSDLHHVLARHRQRF